MPHAHESSVTTAVNRAVRRPTVILWLNEAPVYRRAAAQAGLADRVESHEVPVNAESAPDVLERCDALLAWQVPPDHPFWATEGITVLPHIGGY